MPKMKTKPQGKKDIIRQSFQIKTWKDNKGWNVFLMATSYQRMNCFSSKDEF